MSDSKFTHSLETVLLGMLLGIIAFVILGYSDGLFYSKNIIRWLPTIESEEFVRVDDQVIKLQGVPEVKSPIEAPKYDKDLVYLQRVHEVKNEKGEWEEVRKDHVWSTFTLNGVTVYPENSICYLDLKEIYVDENGDKRQVFYGVDSDETLIVVGMIKEDEIRKDGHVLAISNEDNTVLEKELRQDIHERWWFYKLLAAFLLSIGIVAFFIPVISFLEILPQLGYVAILLIVGVSIVISVLLVAIQTLVFAFWYLILFVLFTMVYLFIRVMVKKKKKPINIIPN